MKEQYNKIKLIFHHKDLSNIDITFIESFQSIKGNYPHIDWNETYEITK